jgi:hypothetical protein
MWGELPKLFGKSFAIGFFLPSAVLLLAFQRIFAAFKYNLLPTAVTVNDPLGVAVSIFILWMGGVTLMALNRPIIRFFEGYGDLNPLRVLKPGKERAFGRLAAANRELENQMDAADVARVQVPPDRDVLYGKLLLRAATKFPDQRDLVLPTRFGNAIRSFEVYPRVVYGMESIPGWSRLIAVIPADFRQAIEDAKAQLDFWVNLWFGGPLIAAIYIMLHLWSGLSPEPWIPVLALAMAFVAWRGALVATGQWGMLVMSSFDLFRGDLCKKLGLKMPQTLQEEREMWTLMSQTMVYRHKQAAERLSRFRDRGGGEATGR